MFQGVRQAAEIHELGFFTTEETLEAEPNTHVGVYI
jgi:hypothetical protein